MKLGRLFRTVRHLRPVQVMWRIRQKLPSGPPQSVATPDLRPRLAGWVSPALRSPAWRGDGVFEFLGECHDLRKTGWDPQSVAKLWRYNLHYFDDLIASGWLQKVEDHAALLSDWIECNPAARGTGWEPYPMSRRIVNIVKWLMSGGRQSEALLSSLVVQAQWLEKRLEYHLLGNHLFTNAKALIFIGLYFQGPIAERWLRRGMQILDRELEEQMLPDGGQFERSPMYHALALEDLLDLVNVMEAFGVTSGNADGLLLRCREKSRQAAAWLVALCHPDQEIAFFNDAAFGIAPSPADLLAYAKALQLTEPSPANLEHLKSSGYVAARLGPATLFADVAPIGPDYLPGHAHADTLSFELSLGTERILVNGGTSVYGTGEERLRQRGTASHNTVEVSGENSSEVWSGFRVGRRARVRNVVVKEEADCIAIAGEHDGYRWLPGRPIHRRSWMLKPDRLEVYDRIVGEAPPRSAIARFRFHPEVSIESSDDGASGLLTTLRGSVLRWSVTSGSAVLRAGTWHPRFGSSLPCTVLTVSCADGEASVAFSWGRA